MKKHQFTLLELYNMDETGMNTTQNLDNIIAEK